MKFSDPPKDSSSSESPSSSSSEDEPIMNPDHLDAKEHEKTLQDNIVVRKPGASFSSFARPLESATVVISDNQEEPSSKYVEQAISSRRDSRGREIDLEERKNIISKFFC